MQTPEHKDHEIAELAKQHMDDFNEFTDIEGLIIRGHILFERGMNRAIELAIPNREAYDPDRFTFSHKIIIANMLCILDNYILEIKTLNKLRNQIAHSLQYDEKLVDIITSEVGRKQPDVMEVIKGDRRRMLMFSISFLCGVVAFAHENTARAYKRREPSSNEEPTHREASKDAPAATHDGPGATEGQGENAQPAAGGA